MSFLFCFLAGLGVSLDSEKPHLVGIDEDVLSTGITLYHLNDGYVIFTKIKTIIRISFENSKPKKKPWNHEFQFLEFIFPYWNYNLYNQKMENIPKNSVKLISYFILTSFLDFFFKFLSPVHYAEKLFVYIQHFTGKPALAVMRLPMTLFLKEV